VTEHADYQWFNWSSPPTHIPGTAISHTLVIVFLTIAANYEMPDLKTYAEYYLKDIIRVDNAW
jgi:hypothetical protein